MRRVFHADFGLAATAHDDYVAMYAGFDECGGVDDGMQRRSAERADIVARRIFAPAHLADRLRHAAAAAIVAVANRGLRAFENEIDILGRDACPLQEVT